MAAASDVLLILRYISNGQDAFGLPAENGAWLIVVNRGDKPFDYSADCTCSGHGIVHGVIGPKCAEWRSL